MRKRDKRIWLTLASPNGFAYTHDKCNPSTGAASHHAGLQLAQCDSTDKDECSSPVVFFLVFEKCRWVWSPAISKHRREKAVSALLVEDNEDCWSSSLLKKEWIIVFHIQICLSDLGTCSTWRGWLRWRHHLTSDCPNQGVILGLLLRFQKRGYYLSFRGCLANPIAWGSIFRISEWRTWELVFS